jgi:acetoin utilization protein AcuC
VSDSTLVLWDEVFAEYDFGASHPLRPLRLELTMALAGQLGVLDRPGVTVAAPRVADDDLLELVHDPSYVSAVKRAPDDLMGRLSLKYGLGTGDVPIFRRCTRPPRCHRRHRRRGAAVWEGTAQHAVNISGGLHHAMRDRASGFCVYDDPPSASPGCSRQGATRVAYVDVDVHHGDGVEAPSTTTPGADGVASTRAAARCSRAPAGPTRSAPATGVGPTSTSRCRWAPATPAGCAPSTPSCRRSCAPSSRR